MDATTKKLCEMLRTGDPELQVAAARVLGELRPKEARVLSALSAELAEGVGPARLYALHALARSPVPQAVAHIFPALAGPAELRQEAIEAVAGFGAAAVAHLKAAILGSDLALRKAAASALARIGSKAAHELLLRALADGSLELSKHICFELDHAVREMTDRGRAALAAQVEAYLGRKGTQKNEVAAASGLILLGFLRVPNSRKVLLGFVRPPHRPELRRRALLALRGIAEALTESDLKGLLPCVEEDDLANVALPAIELLRPLALPASGAGTLIGLAGSPRQAVRDFAIYKMGRLDTPGAAKILIQHLDAPQPALRDLAVSSLRRNTAAVPLLLKRLADEEDIERIWTLARVLEAHAADVSAAQAKALTKLLLDCLESDDRRAEPLAYLARRIASEPMDAALLQRAQALKGKKRFAEADRMLAALVRGGTASPEALYEAGVVALKVSPKGIGRHERNADPCLRRFDALVDDEKFDLARRLRSERCLEPQDLFYVGFHFAEQLGKRRECGGSLLLEVAKAGGRSAVAQHARNKLRLEAFPVEEPRKAKAAPKKAKAAKRVAKTPPPAKKAAKKRTGKRS